MAPASAESPPCSACSIPARLTSPLSTLTTASAPPASPPASTASDFVFRKTRTPLNLLCSLCVSMQFFLLRFQQNLQDSGALRKRHRFLRFLQSKRARNERLQIHCSRVQKRDRLFERPAPRANDVDLFHHNRPRLHGRCAMKCGLQHQRPARFGHLLRQRQSAWRTGSQPHAHQCPAFPQLRQRPRHGNEFSLLDAEGEHSCLAFRFFRESSGGWLQLYRLAQSLPRVGRGAGPSPGSLRQVDLRGLPLGLNDLRSKPALGWLPPPHLPGLSVLLHLTQDAVDVSDSFIEPSDHPVRGTVGFFGERAKLLLTLDRDIEVQDNSITNLRGKGLRTTFSAARETLLLTGLQMNQGGGQAALLCHSRPCQPIYS